MTKNSFLKFRKTLVVCGVVLNSFTVNAQLWENTGPSANVSAGNSSFNNLTADGNGNYYLSYYDVSVAKGSVQKFDGTSWSYLGGSAGITSGTATFNSLCIDGSGNVYYSNQAGYPGSGMEVRKFNSGTWSQLPNVTNTGINYQATAVSPSNVIYAYSSDGSGTVRKYVNGAWEQVGTAGFAGGTTFAEMVIGTDNNIYACQISGGVKVYRINADASASDPWTLVGGSIVGNGYSSDFSFSDIALDGSNTPYVVYVSSTAEGRKLNVKKFDGTNWVQVGAPNFSDTVVNHTAITVSSDGTPYVVASIWDSSNANNTQNTVYRYNSTSGVWAKVGGDFVSDGAASYNDLAIDTANNYLVLAYSQNGTQVKRISLSALSVTDTQKEDIRLYPNPTNGNIYLKGGKIRSAEVINTAGQLIKIKNNDQQLDLTHLPAGMYFINIHLENGNNLSKKIIKK